MVSGILAESIDDRFGTMARFFLVALAVVSPVAWWWRRRRSVDQSGKSTSGIDDATNESEPEVRAPRDLRWLVAAIDSVPDAAIRDCGVRIELVVPAHLAQAVWGTDSNESDPVSATVVADALRRRGMCADDVRARAGSSGPDEVIVTLRASF